MTWYQKCHLNLHQVGTRWIFSLTLLFLVVGNLTLKSIRSLWLMWKLGDSSDGSEMGCLGKIETQVWGMFLHERFLGPWFHLHRGSPDSILLSTRIAFFHRIVKKNFGWSLFPSACTQWMCFSVNNHQSGRFPACSPSKYNVPQYLLLKARMLITDI